MVRHVMDIRYVDIIRARGRDYAYYRRDGRRIRIKAPIGTPEFLAECKELEAGFRSPDMPEVGTLGHTIALYKSPKNPSWSDLSAATRLSYQRAFDALAPYSRKKLRAFTRPLILEIRDQDILIGRGRWMANYAVTVLGVVFSFALDNGIVTENPLAEKVRKLRRPKNAAPANRPWTKAERTVVLGRAEPHVHLTLALFMCSGLRKADVFRVTVSAIKDGEISVRTSKRDTPVRVPVHRLLGEALKLRPSLLARAKAKKGGDGAPEPLQIALTARGQAWTPDGFDTVWHRFRTDLEAKGLIGKGLTLHGLRHTLGTLLKEAGLDDGDIADILGQSGTVMARHYSKQAALPEKSKAAVIGLDLTGKTRNSQS